MKYSLGEKVIHCRNGVATIVSTTEIADREYFVIKAVRGDGENIYVPILGAENIIRPVMEVSEAEKVLESLKQYSFEYNPNTKQRRDAYKRRLSSGKIEDIAYMFRQYQLFRKDNSLRLGPADIDMLKYANDIFLDEMAIIYEQDRDQIDSYIEAKIEK